MTSSTTIMVVTPPCPGCGRQRAYSLDRVRYARFVGGMHVQDAFPDLGVSERERLVTGYCSPCWDRDIGGDE